MSGQAAKENLIRLAHGAGGLESQQLLQELILKIFSNPVLNALDDSARLETPPGPLAFTTDSYVVDPIFFPGGDIGRLAACGTLNDLVMQGARPRYLSLGLILEEGLPLADLEKILNSLAAVLREEDVLLATGDTKVVGRGQANRIFINTSGLGDCLPGVDVRAANARPGDALLLTGTLGDHGIAVLSQREGLRLQSPLTSDVACLWGLLGPLLQALPTLHCLRDPTRGGLAAAVCDIAQASRVGIRLREKDLPVKPEVLGACNLLGLDPLAVANEGKAVVVCPPGDAPRALEMLRAHPLGRESRRIGEIVAGPAGQVVLETRLGGERLLELPAGENLPRIC